MQNILKLKLSYQKNKSFKSNFLWILFGNTLFGLSQWILISLMAKIGNIQMVGEYTLALGITAPLFLLLNLNLRSMQATDQKDEFDFKYYFLLRIITSSITILITIFIITLFNYKISLSIIIFLVAFIKLIESQSDVVYGYFQKIEYMKLISLSKVIRGILNLLVVSILLLTTNSLILSLLGMLLMDLLLFFRFDLINLYKNNVPRLKLYDLFTVIKDKRKLKLIFLTGIPLGISNFLDSLTINSQRYIIESTLSIKELGYYSSITFIMMSGQTIIGALANAALPRLTRYFAEDIKKYIKLINLLILIGLIIGMSLILTSLLFGDSILSFIYTKEFATYTNIFILIMIAGSVWYITGFLNAALLATRKFNYQLYVYLSSFIATFVSTILLTKDLGIIGAAYGLLIGMAVRFLFILMILIYIVSKRYFINLKE
jgi:O-antigen/teichoic acid export membrane protein